MTTRHRFRLSVNTRLRLLSTSKLNPILKPRIVVDQIPNANARTNYAAQTVDDPLRGIDIFDMGVARAQHKWQSCFSTGKPCTIWKKNSHFGRKKCALKQAHLLVLICLLHHLLWRQDDDDVARDDEVQVFLRLQLFLFRLQL